MKPIPITEEVPVLRVDFSNDGTWSQICEAMAKPVPFNADVNFQANIDFLSDREFDGLDLDQVVSLIPKDSHHPIIFVVDSEAISSPDHPILCVDLLDERGRTFRFIPSETWAVENNLSLANMGFAEFLDVVDADGVFRGIDKG